MTYSSNVKALGRLVKQPPEIPSRTGHQPGKGTPPGVTTVGAVAASVAVATPMVIAGIRMAAGH